MKNPSISFIAPLVAAFAFISSASAASVDKADYNTLDLDTHPQIVTNVTFDGLVTERDLTNATNGFLKSETDPTVPDWAKSSSKPAYNWSEISDRPQYIVTYVNSKTGVVVLNALDVGAIPTTGGVFKTARLHLGSRLSVGTWTDSVKPFGQISGSGIAFAFGDNVHSEAANTMTLGVGALNTNAWSFIWNGDADRTYFPTIPSMSNPYATLFNGGFFINPSVRTGMTNPLQNFWIGDTNLNDWITTLSPAPGNYANVSNMAMTAVHCVSDEADVSDSGWTLLVSDGESVLTNVSEVVSGNVTNIVTAVETNSYSVLSLYKDGVKVWTSDPAEQGVGWIVAIVLALVGTGGVATWKFFSKTTNVLKVDPETGEIYYETED